MAGHLDPPEHSLQEPSLGDKATSLQGSYRESFVTKSEATFVTASIRPRGERRVLGEPHHANTHDIPCGVRQLLNVRDGRSSVDLYLTRPCNKRHSGSEINERMKR